LTIIPIFRREMVAAARRGRLQSMRASLAGQLFLLVVGAFAAWYYWAGGVLDSATMGRVATECLRWGVAFHAGVIGAILVWGARSIAKERDSRTLDFVLVTRLRSAEIVLGKLASCLVNGLTWMAAGLPVMILLHVLGGVDLRVILLAYAAFVSGTVFLSAWAIWISAEVVDSRTAAVSFILCVMAWMIGPFSLSVFLPRMGIRLPEWLATVNAWILASSPILIAFQLATGLDSWPQLTYLVGRMSGLQLAGAVLFTIAAIVRLRPVHRALAGIDRSARRRERRRLVWRLRPRPPVGDDPIFWREKYTSRQTGFLKALGVLIFGGLSIGLVAATVYYAVPAFAELWRHGYGSPTSGAWDPDANILIRLFLRANGPGGLVDQARTDFNIFIRCTSVAIVLIMSFLVGGIASEVIGIERLKDTWSSLLGTPLGGVDIVRSVMRVTLWRSRGIYGVVLVLWALGLLSGAIHPLGFVVSILELAASVWMMSTFGALVSIHARKGEDAMSRGLLITWLLTCTGVLPLLLPVGLNSVLWGAGSLPLMVWTSLLSYREVAAATAAPLDPHFVWYGMWGGQMPVLVLAAWLIAVVGPALAGLWAWRYALAHFDRLVGRPNRSHPAAEVPVSPPPPARSRPRRAVTVAGRGSPLAEADGAV
jgi:hypothetical protein